MTLASWLIIWTYRNRYTGSAYFYRGYTTTVHLATNQRSPLPSDNNPPKTFSKTEVQRTPPEGSPSAGEDDEEVIETRRDIRDTGRGDRLEDGSGY